MYLQMQTELRVFQNPIKRWGTRTSRTHVCSGPAGKTSPAGERLLLGPGRGSSPRLASARARSQTDGRSPGCRGWSAERHRPAGQRTPVRRSRPRSPARGGGGQASLWERLKRSPSKQRSVSSRLNDTNIATRPQTSLPGVFSLN